MAQLTAGSSGKVVALQGKAVARTPGGGVRLLALGDWVAQNDVIITAQNGFVQLATAEAAAPSPFAADYSLASLSPPAVDPAPAPAPFLALAPEPPSRPPSSSFLTDSAGSSLQSALRVDALAAGSSGLGLPGLAAGLGAAASPGSQRSEALRSLTDRLAPSADELRLSTLEDTALSIRLSGHDTDGSLSRYLVLKVPTGGVTYKPGGVPISDGAVLLPSEAEQLVFSPAPDFHGDPGALQYRVVDNAGHVSPVASVAISVVAVNDAPLPGTVPLGPDDVAISDPSPNHLPGTPDYRYSTAVDTPVAGQVQATDVDLDPMRFSTATGPLHGQVLLQADGRFVYQAAAGYQGSDQFVVQVDDGRGGIGLSTVFIEVGSSTPQHTDKLPTAVVDAADEASALNLSPGVFAWSLAEPLPAVGSDGLVHVAGDTHALGGLTPTAISAPLDLRDLLPGLAEELMLPGHPGATGPASSGPEATALPAGQALDLHLDLALGWAWHRPPGEFAREPIPGTHD